MKKILFILPSLAVGGLERVQVTLANKLVNQGYDVTILILEPIDDLKVDLDEKVRLIYRPYKNHFGKKYHIFVINFMMMECGRLVHQLKNYISIILD